MVTKKQLLKQILERVQELENYIKSDEFNQLKQDSEELKTTKELLSHVKFKVKDINYFEDNNSVQIRYELPIVNLQLDEQGEPDKNDFFYSVNMLEMIGLEDVNKILDYLEKVQTTINLKERSK